MSLSGLFKLILSFFLSLFTIIWIFDLQIISSDVCVEPVLHLILLKTIMNITYRSTN